MNLVFSSAGSLQKDRTLGPLRCFRIDRNGLQELPLGPVLASHAGRQWEMDGERFLRLDCSHPVFAQFETATLKSSRYGPYAHFSAVDGVAYSDRQVFAALDGAYSEDWYCYRDGLTWAVLVVTRADDTPLGRALAALAALAPVLAGAYGAWHGISARHLGASKARQQEPRCALEARCARTAELIAHARRTVEQSHFFRTVARGIRQQCAAT